MTNPKSYLRPTTLDEAVRLAAQPGTIALAGGALLLGTLDFPYETVVDLQAVPELNRTEANENGVTVGGALSLQTLVESDSLIPALKRSITRFLPLNQRSNTSVGESLIAPQPLREWLAALVALDVGVELIGSDGTHDTYSIAELTETDSEPTLHSGIIASVFIPHLEDDEALGAAFVARTPADDPIVNAAAFVRLNEDRTVENAFVALCGASAHTVSNIHMATLEGMPFDEANIASAAKWIVTQISPVDDWRGTADYRREMARVTAQRALLDCLAQLNTKE
jgi:CO/xanthine dehydrogenase FAD-binding subunit